MSTNLEKAQKLADEAEYLADHINENWSAASRQMDMDAILYKTRVAQAYASLATVDALLDRLGVTVSGAQEVAEAVGKALGSKEIEEESK